MAAPSDMYETGVNKVSEVCMSQESLSGFSARRSIFIGYLSFGELGFPGRSFRDQLSDDDTQA